MRNQILILALIAVSFVSTLNISKATQNNPVALGGKPRLLLVLIGTGSLSTTAGVAATNLSTNQVFTGYYDTPGVYFIDGMPEGNYKVTVCSNYPAVGPTYGEVNNLYFDGNSAGEYINLNGICPSGGD